MGLDKPGRLRVDQPTITGELSPAPDAYTHYSPVMIIALSKTAGRSAFDEGGPFFCAKPEAGLRTRPDLILVALTNSVYDLAIKHGKPHVGRALHR